MTMDVDEMIKEQIHTLQCMNNFWYEERGEASTYYINQCDDVISAIGGLKAALKRATYSEREALGLCGDD